MTTTAPPRTSPSLAVACPDCGSAAGERCVNSQSGRQRQTAHPLRVSAARAARTSDQPAAPAAEPTPEVRTPVAEPTGPVFTVGADGTAEQPAAEAAPAVVVDARTLGTQLLAIAVLEARVAEAKADLRATLMGQLRVGESVVGCLDADDDDPVGNGTALGKVLKKRGATSWKVTDQAKLLAWVEAHAPTEVVTTRKVRDSYVPVLLAHCKKDGGWVDPDTSELIVPDGVEYSEASSTLQVSKSGEAAELVAAAVAAGLLHADGSLALPAGGAA